MSDYKITVTLEGPDTSEPDDRYEKRDTLAKMEVPVEPGIGWDIYQTVIEKAIAPTMGITVT